MILVCYHCRLNETDSFRSLDVMQKPMSVHSGVAMATQPKSGTVLYLVYLARGLVNLRWPEV